MFFCPKCNYSLDISKNIPQEISGDIQLRDPKDFIDMFQENDLEGNIKIIFSKKDMLSNRYYKKLDSNEKEEIQTKFNEINSIGYNLAYFVCKNCQFITKINKGSTIYSVTTKSNNVITSKYRHLDNTLPRTKDYICPNSKCNSHKSKDKEAVFYRPEKNSYRLEYECVTCNTKWDIRNKTL